MKMNKPIETLHPVAAIKQLLLAISFCLIFLCSPGQVTDKQLVNVNTIEQANQFIQSYPKLDSRLFTITSDKDTSDITLPLFDKKTGYTFSIDDLTFKIVESISYPEFRAYVGITMNAYPNTTRLYLAAVGHLHIPDILIAPEHAFYSKMEKDSSGLPIYYYALQQDFMELIL